MHSWDKTQQIREGELSRASEGLATGAQQEPVTQKYVSTDGGPPVRWWASSQMEGLQKANASPSLVRGYSIPVTLLGSVGLLWIMAVCM